MSAVFSFVRAIRRYLSKMFCQPGAAPCKNIQIKYVEFYPVVSAQSSSIN